MFFGSLDSAASTGRAVKRWGAIGLLAAGTAWLAGCAVQAPGRLRYRMTVEVETPEGVKSGSSVIESTITKGMRFGDSSGISYAVKGEAVTVDLGGGQMLFALLSGLDMEPAEFHARLFHNALKRGAAATPPLPRKYKAFEWREERQAARNIKPTVILQPSDYPKVVRFRNPRDFRTVEIVNESDDVASNQVNLQIKRIIIAVTDDDVTYGNLRQLPDFSAATGYGEWIRSLAYGDPRRIGPEDFRGYNK
ncbi:MAG: hypothetical protein WBR13_07795 [Allosphingosinicella sp.]